MKSLVVASALTLLALSPALAQPTPAQKAQASVLRDACRSDYVRLCNGVRPGGGRILACFEGHAGDLSPSCKTALDAARAARN
ncbi:MAG: cysteine rich repeat-containing protein [Hyphomicrobiales bacterium]|nr:cysteine rich repeat-containing protein [Hyphomicrobiales bacterium]